MKKIWQFFCSLKLTVYTGLVICGLLLAGSLCFLGSGAERLGELNERILLPWLLERGWPGLVDTWWIWLLLACTAILGLNTLACTLDRLPKLAARLRNPRLDVNAAWFANLPLRREIVLEARPEQAEVMVKKALSFGGFRKQRQSTRNDGGRVVFAQRGGWTIFGPYIAHLGFLLVLAGHLASSIWGYKDMGRELVPGQRYQLPQSPLWVQLLGVGPCDKDEGDFSQKCGQVFAGTEKERVQAVLRPNRPLFFEGHVFYQGGLDRGLEGVNLTLSAEGKTASSLYRIGEQHPAAKGVTLLPYTVIPDFVFDSRGRPASRSDDYNNPALYLLLFKQGAPVKQGWLFLNKDNMRRMAYKDMEITFSGLYVQSRLYINIVRNPGAWTVLWGGVIFMGGCFWFLFGNHRRLWFLLEEAGEGKTRLLCGGFSTQKRHLLQSGLDDLLHGLKTHFAP